MNWYLAGYITISIVVAIMINTSDRINGNDLDIVETFLTTVIAFFWPLMVVAAVIVAPFVVAVSLIGYASQIIADMVNKFNKKFEQEQQ